MLAQFRVPRILKYNGNHHISNHRILIRTIVLIVELHSKYLCYYTILLRYVLIDLTKNTVISICYLLFVTRFQ
jgi:hypothetical protein